MVDLTSQKTTRVFGVPTQPSSIKASAPVAAPAVSPATPTPGPRYEEQDRQHQGVAGVGRDILGTLGDFLLTKLGMPAMYAPAQERRREAAATEGFDADPLSAISRLESINPTAGRELRNQFIDNQRLQAQQESTAEARDARLALSQEAANVRTRGYAAGMLETMTGWDDGRRQQFWPQVREQALRAAKAQGLDLRSELPEVFDPVALDAFIGANITPGAQRTQRLSGERIETTQRGQDLSAEARAASLEETRRRNLAAEEDRDASRASAEARAAASLAARGAGSSNSRSPASSRTPRPTGSGRPRSGDIVTMPDGTQRRIR